MEKSTDYVLRPRTRRCRHELRKCQDCADNLTDENWTKSMQKYRRYVCAKCWSTRQRRYQETDPNWKIKKVAKARQTRAKWSDVKKAEESKKRYGRWLKRNYGMTLEDYDAMLGQQLYRCAVCRTDEPSGKGRFHVDHCHSSGGVRGLLCTNCNMMLGLVRDSEEILRSAIKYLDEHKSSGKAY